MALYYDLNWTPALENKVSTQIDGQLPDFIAEDHPKFAQFLKHYYQFLEAGELRLTVNIDNILLELETSSNFLNEDDTLFVTESGSGSTGKFVAGETITGGTSYATATVLVEDLGDENPRLFISSQQLFETGETVTGGTSGASGVVTRYRANPVQNIQQMLAYADIDNTIYDFIEEFRKSFMEGIPNNLSTGINKRNLEKHIRELYRRKGTKEGAKLFMKILLDENAEVFYPNQYMLKVSAADWDKPTIIRCATVGAIVADEVIGQSVTGLISGATALVENATVFSVTGTGVSYVEFELSSIIGTFIADETIYAVSSVEDVRYNFTVKNINTTVSITNDGTLYQTGDSIDLDTATTFGSGDVSAKVDTVQTGSVSGVLIDDAGTNYEVGDLVVFIDNGSDAGLVYPASAEVTVIHGNVVDETDSDIILLEDGTNKVIELFNFQLEVGTVHGEQPYAVYGTNILYSNVIGYYYPMYVTNYAATQSTITKSSALVNGATFASKTVTLDGNAGGTIAIGMTVRGTSISLASTVTVTAVASQTSITISSVQTLLDDETLMFQSAATDVTEYTFLEYPGITFYSPDATVATAQLTYSSSTYALYGGNYNHRQDHLYGESGNVASYGAGSVNTELVLGDRFQSEFEVNQITLDTFRYANEGIMLESGSGDIAKINMRDGGKGYSLLPTATVRSQYGTSAAVFATTVDIGRIQSVNVTNHGFNYTETPTLELRANFLIKDRTGTFVAGVALTAPGTGTVRSYDSTTQILTVSIEDTIAIGGEQLGADPAEGILLEDSLVDHSYVNDNLISDSDLLYGENLVDASGDRILIDALLARTDYILLENDQGELIMEHQQFRLSYIDLEEGTNATGFLITEDDRDYIVSEDEDTELPFEWDARQIKFVQETSSPDDTKIGAGDFVVLDADLVSEEDLVLNGTDASSTDAGNKILFNGTDASGTNDSSNLIVMEAGTDSGADANNELLQDAGDDDFTNLVLDGTNSSNLHNSQKILFEDTGVDYLTAATTISTANATATILNVDIAKASFSLGTKVEKRGSFGGIESLISEELIRIQDSYYYQQFSYEVRSNAGGSAYLNELRKAVHPAGFNVFAKVIQTSLVSMKITTTGSSLGTNDYSTDIYSAILASTFRTLFSETVQRRLGVQTEEEFETLLETSIIQRDGDLFILEDGTSAGFLQLETPENAYPDFEAIIIDHDIGAGDSGVLLTEDLDRIVSEKAEVISNNLVFNGTEDAHIYQADDGSNILTEEDSLSLSLEDALEDHISFFLGEEQSITDNVIDETDSQPFVYDGNVDLNADVFLRSIVTTKITAKAGIGSRNGHGHSYRNGLEFLATTNIASITGDRIELEYGLSVKGSHLLLSNTDATDVDAGFDMLLEADSDVNLNESVTITTYLASSDYQIRLEYATIANDSSSGDGILQEEDGVSYIITEEFTSSSDTIYEREEFTRNTLISFPNEGDGIEDDFLILEGQEVGTLKQEDETTVTGTFGDNILLEDKTSFSVGTKIALETTPIEEEQSVAVVRFEAKGKTKLESFTFPADIFVAEIGKLSLQDNEYGFIVYDTAADVNDQILLEDGTETDLYIQSVLNEITTKFGFDGTALTFDTLTESWDKLLI